MKKNNKLKYFLIMIAIGTVIFACSKSSGTMNASNPNSVSIKNMAFSPSALSVTAGTTVTWTNNDAIAHTVTADDLSFNSSNIAPGSSYAHTFSSTGTVSYHCSIHPMMTGSVSVK